MKSLILLAALTLSACGTKPAETPATPSPVATGNATAAVIALSEPQRRGMVLRAIRDAGIECQGVTASQETAKDPAPRWRATCTNGRNYLVDVSPDGTAHIVGRAGE